MKLNSFKNVILAVLVCLPGILKAEMEPGIWVVTQGKVIRSMAVTQDDASVFHYVDSDGNEGTIIKKVEGPDFVFYEWRQQRLVIIDGEPKLITEKHGRIVMRKGLSKGLFDEWDKEKHESGTLPTLMGYIEKRN